jgi:predicted Rossmann fold flavoprotein
VAKTGDSFTITSDRGATIARTLILATGGKSLPKTGSDGAGYAFAQALGHTLTPTFPALVPLVLEEGHWITRLTGLSIDAELSVLTSTGKVVRRDRGPLLLTHFGLSGPVALDISRHWGVAHAIDSGTRLTANLMPGMEFADAEKFWLETAAARPRTPVVAVLRSLRMPERLARAVSEDAAGVASDTSLAQLTKGERRSLVHALTALPLPVVRDRGYLFAEVTAGGVPLSEVDVTTMASRRCPGLFLCGEILDVDGKIGGYNFQWAWATGRLAGMHAVRGLASASC